jgi:Holliday junction resolvasome RuvABC endonuclease subunit
MAEAIIGIDPGCETGIAYRRRDGTVLHRTWLLVGADGVRINKLSDRLTALHEQERFIRVGYEAPFGGPNFTPVRVLVHFEAVILSWAARLGLAVEGYRPPELKQAVGLKGNATKDQVIVRVRALGYPVEDEHQADAVAALLRLIHGMKPAEVVRKAAVRDQRKRALDLFAAARATRRRAAKVPA